MTTYTSTKKQRNREPYVESMVQDAQTTGSETKSEINDFLQTISEFNKTDAAATRQKKINNKRSL